MAREFDEFDKAIEEALNENARNTEVPSNLFEKIQQKAQEQDLLPKEMNTKKDDIGFEL